MYSQMLVLFGICFLVGKKVAPERILDVCEKLNTSSETYGTKPGEVCRCEGKSQITHKVDEDGNCITCPDQHRYSANHLCVLCADDENCGESVRAWCKTCSKSELELRKSRKNSTTEVFDAVTLPPSITVIAPTTTVPITTTKPPPTPVARRTEMMQPRTHASNPTTFSVHLTNASKEAKPVMDMKIISIILVVVVLVGALVCIICKFKIFNKNKKLCCPKNKVKEQSHGKVKKDEQEHLNKTTMTNSNYEGESQEEDGMATLNQGYEATDG